MPQPLHAAATTLGGQACPWGRVTMMLANILNLLFSSRPALGMSLGILTTLLGVSESLSKSGSSMTKDSICAAIGPSGSLSDDAASSSFLSS